ncbi:MAG: 3-keto-disaccharide hydrolase [Thermoguttaceae bacterium]
MRTWCTFPLVLLALALPGGAGEPSPKSEDAKPAPSQAEEGFVPLFPGDSFEGWQGAISGYQLDRGVLVSKEDSGGTLLTKKEYADFILRFEFKLSPGGNNGIALRAPLDGRTSQTGMEIQVLDDTAEKYKNLQPYQYHGSLYGLVPARRGHLKPVGEWNEQEILCQGRHIRVTLNGTVIVDANLDDLGPVGMDGYVHEGRYRTSGRLGFMGHRSRVDFRNLRIKECSASPALDKK